MRRMALLGVLISMAVVTPASAQDAPAIDATKVALDTLWVMLAGMLVFFMNAGFATLETGLCRAKNAVNILAKNFIVFALFDRVLGDRVLDHVRRR